MNIDKTQGNAIYSSLLAIRSTLDNFKLDVKKDSLREVVDAAIKKAVSEYLNKQAEKSAANEEKLRKEGMILPNMRCKMMHKVCLANENRK